MILRRTGRVSASVATGRRVLNLPRAYALRDLIEAFIPTGVSHLHFLEKFIIFNFPYDHPNTLVFKQTFD